MQKAHLFAGLDGAPRPAKPRTEGLTMVVDWGYGPNAQEDLIAANGPYFDFAKVAVGISRLLTSEALVQKLKLYRENEIEAFPGGQYLEYAEVYGKTDLYFPAVVNAGYRWVEVSDNLASVSLAWKQRMIRQACEEFKLNVLGEVGKKEGLESTVSMVDDAKACLDAGARIILLEAAELIEEETAEEVAAVVNSVGLKRVMFELPGPWIEGVNLHDIHRMRRELIERYGPRVNLGNVSKDDVMTLEAFRRKLGVNAGTMEEN